MSARRSRHVPSASSTAAKASRTPTCGRTVPRSPPCLSSFEKASFAQACGVKCAILRAVVREDLERRHRAAERGQAETEQQRDRAGLLLGREEAAEQDGRTGADEAEGEDDRGGAERVAPVDAEEEQRAER